MPYCGKCGTKLEDDARFCHKCGSPVAIYPPPQQVYVPRPVEPAKPLHKDSLVVVSIALVAVLVVAVVAVVILAAPFATWSSNESLEDKTVGVKTLNFDFHTNVGKVVVFTQKMGNNNIGIYIQANGSRGIVADSSSPIAINFENNTVADTLTVNSNVTVADVFTTGAHVQCMIYIDPALAMNLNISSTTGQVSFSGIQSANIQSLWLETTTGEAQANFDSNMTLAGNVTVRAVTGEVNFRMSQINIKGNCSLALHSSTGAINADLTQTKAVDGNLNVETETSTGSINFALNIDGGIGGKITSQVSGFGGLDVQKNNFVGSDEDIQSVNYPAQSNIVVNNQIHGFGGVNIRANYLTTLISS
jgi:hypothetical protein